MLASVFSLYRVVAHVDTYILTRGEIASMREDYSFYGGVSFVLGGLVFALSFEWPLKLSYRYGGLFFVLVGIVILLAGIGTKRGDFDDCPGEEMGVIRPRN